MAHAGNEFDLGEEAEQAQAYLRQVRLEAAGLPDIISALLLAAPEASSSGQSEAEEPRQAVAFQAGWVRQTCQGFYDLRCQLNQAHAEAAVPAADIDHDDPKLVSRPPTSSELLALSPEEAECWLAEKLSDTKVDT
ncbi:hypothetical protein WJX73_000812 [Symbiochloris irregularis]|uniref:Uncharacterized protein n=1 Tax=Symbiochloris irregularis TaxID=706552 RepID=A0AAW1PME6_9CHLO